MDKPLVTIITPTHNAARWLPETVESILLQDYPHLEYIILDDGSTDTTQSKLDKYRSDPRVHIFYHPNMGEVLTINKGYQLSHGLLVGNISADDPLFRSSAISQIVEASNANPDALVFYPDFWLTDAKGALLQPIRTREWSYEYMITHHHCTPGPGALLRRKVFDLIGLRNPDPGIRWVADLEYWLRIGQIGPMQRVPHLLATHRRHPEQLTLKMQGRDMAQQHILLYTHLFERLRRNEHLLADQSLTDWLNKSIPQGWAYTYLTCAYVCPRDYRAMAYYLIKALRAYPPIVKDIAPLLIPIAKRISCLPLRTTEKGAKLCLPKNRS